MSISVDVRCNIPEGVTLDGVFFQYTKPDAADTFIHTQTTEPALEQESQEEQHAASIAQEGLSAMPDTPELNYSQERERYLRQESALLARNPHILKNSLAQTFFAQSQSAVTPIEYETWLALQHHELVQSKQLWIDPSEERSAQHALKLRYFSDFERRGYKAVDAAFEQGEFARGLAQSYAAEWLNLQEHEVSLTQESWKVRLGLFGIAFVLGASLLAYFK